MTRITDQQRREVAARLRKGEGLPIDVLMGYGLIEDCDKATDILANLIDRPTCRAVLCHGGFYGCTRCGYDGWADAESVTRFCPECGAEVER